MPEHHPTIGDDKSAHAEVDYDRSEASLLGIAIVLLGIASTFGIAVLIAFWFVDAHKPAIEANPSLSSYGATSTLLPPEPRLEPLDSARGGPQGNGFARQLAMEHLLHSYGRTPDASFVHIPVEEAMKLAISKLPAQPRTSAQTFKSYGLVEGGESNSGRIYQEAPSWFESAH
jgi:hypothetical protein